MSYSKLRAELLLFLWVFLLHQTSETLCASLQNYSLKSGNHSAIQNNMSQPENLSELIVSPENPSNNESVQEINVKKKFNPESRREASLSEIEFGPSDDYESVNHSVVERHYEIPKIIPFRVKSNLFVLNPYSNNHSVEHTNEEKKFNPEDRREASWSDIEFGPGDPNYEFMKIQLNNREKRMNNLNEESDDSEGQISSTTSSISKSTEKDLETADSEENKVVQNTRRSKYATGRQFLFNPYVQYGKDTPSDEKISFDDILPIKMVKFVKSMVEEAPWEQMFMKMVRMIVDEFVDKIIEKMFADKGDDHHFKKRSFDLVLTPTFVLPTYKTPIVRLKRSVSAKNSPDQDEDIFNYLPPKKSVQDTNVEGKKSPEENKTWLDHFLDLVFPNSKDEMFDLESLDRLKKRDTRNTQFLKTLVTFFLKTFEKSSGFLFNAKDVLRHKMLKEFLPYLYQKKYGSKNSADLPNPVNVMKMTHRKFSDGIAERNDVSVDLPNSLKRSKRSTRGHSRKDDDDRLWQAHSQRHKPSSDRSHGECSLRKACNAGRLLSRLPSVQEITFQLRSNGNEPHWDAMIWGMKKKRCSRIFCKRQRSPKGSRYSWETEGDRHPRKDEIVTDPPDAESDESNLTT